ncbi:Cytochrome c oxidase polypeptide 5, mitochondrial [Grifola frondosa]|uniref:Cytochrome c oxidase polypeptide 5, mitochondrial n=1 Tax=Grifola frondosa TaxID=5627 RepID=A0A1C7LMF7_GRIFR|nr:Cytochrome c oxidase polypeptide 5, mitochondrial [Grifola frondosa]
MARIDWNGDVVGSVALGQWYGRCIRPEDSVPLCAGESCCLFSCHASPSPGAPSSLSPPLPHFHRRRVGSPCGDSPSSAVIPLHNVEAQWERLSADEQLTVHQQLEEIQKKDWKTPVHRRKEGWCVSPIARLLPAHEPFLLTRFAVTFSIFVAYYVAFGPHGPRTPTNPPGTVPKVLLGVGAIVGTSAVLYYSIKAVCTPGPPRTINKEWEEASNQRALDQKMNPISGIASEGYSGRGFVTHK